MKLFSLIYDNFCLVYLACIWTVNSVLLDWWALFVLEPFPAPETVFEFPCLRLVLSSSLQSSVFSCLASLLFSNTVVIYLVSVALDGLVSSLSYKQSKK